MRHSNAVRSKRTSAFPDRWRIRKSLRHLCIRSNLNKWRCIEEFTLNKYYDNIVATLYLQVESGSKAEEIGLKRGDQILYVNGQSFQHITYAKAIESLCSSTHLSITVKANLSGRFASILITVFDASKKIIKRIFGMTVALKEVQKVPDNVPVSKNGRMKPTTRPAITQPDSRTKVTYYMSLNNTPLKTKSASSGFMTLDPRNRIQRALRKILPKSSNFS